VSAASITRDQQAAIQSDLRVRQASQFLVDQQELRIAMLNRKSDLNLYLYNATPRYADAFDADGRRVTQLLTTLGHQSPSAAATAHLADVQVAIAGWESWAAPAKQKVDETGKIAASNTSAQGATLFAGFNGAIELLAADARAHLQRSLNETQRIDREEQLVIVACAVLLALIVVILVALLVRRVLQPLERLAVAARTLAHDNGVSVPMVGRRDEVGDVARALAGWQRTAAAALRLGRILDSSSNEIYLFDVDLRILEANQTASEHLGYTLDELTGRPVDEIVGLNRQVLVAQATSLLSQQAPEIILESTNRRKDGTEYPVEVRLQVSRSTQQPVYVAIVQDITERRQFAEVTRESEAKSRFLAAMSHELRTPLNSILGFAQLLALRSAGPLTTKQERYVSIVESSGQHLLQLINGVLDLAKVASGHVVMKPEKLSLHAVVTDAVERVRPLSDGKRLRLTIASEPELLVWADHLRLHQVVLNLLSNAIKFTAEGGAVVVETRRAGRMSVISVRDTGLGIPADHLDSIFGEFIQVETGLARHGEGTGLGLALSRRLVTLMNGTIAVESELGVGSVFTVSLPMRPPRAAAMEQAQPREAEGAVR
jgi:PAS domain S-box-containing protein